MHKLYKITNIINQKVYIGQTVKTIEQRFYRHKQNFKKGSCLKLFNAMNKYGRDNFKIELIAQTSSLLVIDYLEELYIKEFDSIKNGYNILKGGSNGWLGHKHSEETKEKMKLAWKERAPISEETRKRMSQANKKNNAGQFKPGQNKKFDKEKVELIQKDISLKISTKELCLKYNCHRDTISKIKRGNYLNG